jgi:hypothetical protein
MGVAFGGEQNGLKIKKEENMEQAAAVGQPQAAPTQQSPIQTNLAVFDKYVPSKEELNQLIASLKGVQDASGVQQLMANAGWKKISGIMNKIESQLPWDARSFPPTDENWLSWYKNKGIIDNSNNIVAAKVPEVFTPVVQKYDFEKIKQVLGKMKEFAISNPQKANYREFRNFVKTNPEFDNLANMVGAAYAVGAAIGGIDRAGNLVGLTKLA